ncbi:MAG: peptidoglycan-binding protein [Actinomycetota bacterium]
MRIIRHGDRGEDVRDVQHRLVALGFPIDPSELEGTFGDATVRAVRSFQQGRRLPVDGLVGPDTWGQLVEAGYQVGDRTLYLRYPFLRGDDVCDLQRRLNSLGFDAGKEDGILGRETDSAIRDFQRNVGQEIDGIVGPDTVTAMTRLRPDKAATSRAVVREGEAVRQLRTPVEGAVVAIDAGGGSSSESGGAGPSGLGAATALVDLSKELAAELRIRGAVPVVLAGEPDRERAASPSERAAAANQAGAAVCISFDVEGEQGPGCSAAFFGTSTTYSPMGERLAELIVEQLAAAGITSHGTRRLAVSILRETRMTAVVVEPARLSDAQDETRLRDPSFRREVATSVADAIASFLRADVSA